MVDSVLVTRVLAGVVESVIARLNDQGIDDAPLLEEWDAIQQADEEEVQFCLAAARLGLDPYSEAAAYENALVRSGRELQGKLLEDFLNVVNPQRLDSALDWVASARDVVAGSTGRQELLLTTRAALRDEFSTGDRLPWRRGWRQARRVREECGLDPGARIDPGRYVTSVSRPLVDGRLQAVGGTGSNLVAAAVVLGGSPKENARRFTLSRALWHFLAEDDPIFLVTASYNDRQKIERAFAAELLAPARGIEERLGSDSLAEEDLEEIADHFGVSVKVVEHQIQNQLLGDAA